MNFFEKYIGKKNEITKNYKYKIIGGYNVNLEVLLQECEKDLGQTNIDF